MSPPAGGRCFVDTNVLLYTFQDEDSRKRDLAIDLVALLARERRGVLSTQVLLELFNNLVRKVRVSPLTASRMTAAFCEWPIVDSDTALVMRGMARATESRLAIWDAMMVEAALRAEATTLYSENLNHGQRFGALQLVNPFV